jgi:hypothetical protein
MCVVMALLNRKISSGIFIRLFKLGFWIGLHVQEAMSLAETEAKTDLRNGKHPKR